MYPFRELRAWYKDRYRSILELRIFQDVVIRSEKQTLGLQCIYFLPEAFERRKNIPTFCRRIKVRFFCAFRGLIVKSSQGYVSISAFQNFQCNSLNVKDPVS